jgi:hypothetical protein
VQQELRVQLLTLVCTSTGALTTTMYMPLHSHRACQIRMTQLFTPLQFACLYVCIVE